MEKFKKGPTPKGKTNAENKGINPASTAGYKSEKRQEAGGRRSEGIYQELPSRILNLSHSGEEEEAVKSESNPEHKGPKDIQEFVFAVAAASGARMPKFGQPFFHLDKKKRRSQRKSSNCKVPFSVSEKRQLGLHLLPRKGLKFEQFVPLHAMWKGYMMDFMNIEELKALGFRGLPSDPRWAEFSVQLLKADYHGAFVSVSRSRCPSLVGASGVVVMETKNAFKLIGRDDVLRTVPKASSVFSLTLDDFALTVFGKYMCVRPAERSVRKIKSRMSADL